MGERENGEGKREGVEGRRGRTESEGEQRGRGVVTPWSGAANEKI